MIKLKPKSAVTRSLCAVIPAGRVRIEPETPTCGVGREQGRVVLIVGNAFIQGDDAMREMMLRHEAHHIFCNHMSRRQAREHTLWNRVCDAAIHYQTNVNPEMLDKGIGGKVVTYERLGIPPMPPEIAYAKLKREEEQGKPTDGPEGCGSGQHPDYQDGTGADGKAPKSAWISVVAAVMQGAQEEVEEGEPHPFEPSHQQPQDRRDCISADGHGMGTPIKRLPPPPEWVDDLMHKLTKERGKIIYGRTYKRENRHGNPWLPGRGRSRRWAGVFVVDASGSIDESALAKMLAAVCLTPELQGSTVQLFDTQVGRPWTVNQVDEIMQDIRHFRGGTCIKKAGEEIGTDKPRVWFTDCMTSDGFPPREEDDLWVCFERYGEDPVIRDYPKERRGW